MKQGKITYEYGASPNEQEKSVAKALTKLGKSITFIAAKRIPHYHTPDIFMDSVFWEIKSIYGNNKRTLLCRIKEAVLQSENVIIDLRQSKMNNEVAIKHIINYLPDVPKAKRIVVFQKNCKFLAIKGKTVL